MLKKLLVLALLADELNVSVAHGLLGRQDDHGTQTLGIIDDMVGFMTNAVSVMPQMLDLMGQIITGPPPPTPTPTPEPTDEPGPAPDPHPERIDMYVARDPSWTGPMVDIPPYTDDYETILERLRTIGVSITKIDFEEIWEERGLSEELWETFKGDRGPYFEDYVEAGLFTDNYEDYVRQHLLPANRWPAFGPDEAVMNNTLTALDDCSAIEFMSPICFNPVLSPANGMTAQDRLNAASAWWAMHANFYQGEVCDGNPPGLVDPTVTPIGVEARFVYPMSWGVQQGLAAEKPMYHFFYYGNGLFAKIRLWVGDTVGWDVSYPGGWPHGTVPHGIAFAGYYTGLLQMPCVNERQIAWYNADDPNTQATSDAFAEQYAITGIPDPDLPFSLGKNPWVDPSMISLENLHMSVYGDDEPACYAGDPSLCTPNPLFPDAPLVIRPLPE